MRKIEKKLIYWCNFSFLYIFVLVFSYTLFSCTRGTVGPIAMKHRHGAWWASSAASAATLTSIVVFLMLTVTTTVKAELTPPYFNLAEGRKISASATCGVDTDGPELYCKLVGANTENDHQDYSVIQGQVSEIRLYNRCMYE